MLPADDAAMPVGLFRLVRDGGYGAPMGDDDRLLLEPPTAGSPECLRRPYPHDGNAGGLRHVRHGPAGCRAAVRGLR